MNIFLIIFHYIIECDEMKKIIFLVICLVIGLLVYNKSNELIIPSNAIRVRIIANSNNIKDLYEKKKIKNEIKEDLYNLVLDATNVSDARDNIQNNITKIEELVASKTKDYKINYGINYFPKKNYKGVIYDEGNYESLVITLGKGLGDNWWCVLYPPLCLIDDNDNTSDVEYRLLVRDLLAKNVSN